MEVLRQLLEDARAVMADMSTTQRVSVATLVATVAALLVFAVHMGGREADQGSVPLEFPVEAAEAKDLVQRLNAEGLGPAVFQTDMKIYVPMEKARDAWLFLAQENLIPPEAAAGFREMLMDWTFSTTRDKSAEMVRIAMGTEVARMIERLKPIKSARVIYSGPGRNRLFRPEQSKRAAVAVSTKLGQSLTQSVANTIINLVAAAQAGLEKRYVEITDQDGRHFRAEDPEDESNWAMKQGELEDARNRQLKDRIEALCRQFLPGSEAWAFVDVEMICDKREEWVRDYSEGVPLTREQEKEKQESTKEPAAEVGTRPNVGRAANLSGAGTKEYSKRERKSSRQTMQNDIREMWTKKAPSVKRKTISAIVQMPWEYRRGVKQKDGTWDWKKKTKDDGTPADYIPEEDQSGEIVMDQNGNPILKKFSKSVIGTAEVQRLEKLIAKAAGIADADIREVIEVMPVPYPESAEFAVAPPSATMQLFKQFRDNVVPILMLVLLFACVFFVYLQAKRALPADEISLPEDQTMAMEMLPAMSEEDQDQVQFEQLRTKVADAVSENPAKAAGLIRRWMTKENY